MPQDSKGDSDPGSGACLRAQLGNSVVTGNLQQLMLSADMSASSASSTSFGATR